MSVTDVMVTDASATSRKLARTSSMLFLRRGILMIASGLSTVYVARYLEPSSYGVLQGAVATWTLITGISDFGFSVALGRDFAAEPRRRAAMLRAAYEVQLLISLAMTLVLVGLALAAGATSTQGLCLLVLAPSVLTTSLNSGRVLYVAMFDVRRTVRIDLVTNLLQIVLTVIVALAGGGAVGVAAVISVGTAANGIWIGVAAIGVTGWADPDRTQRRELVRRAVPLGVMAILSKLYVSIDLAILSFLIVGPALGNYAAAAKIIMLANLAPAILFSSALSGLAEVSGNSALFRQLVDRIWVWMTVILLPAFAILAVYAKPLIVLALGAKYAPAGGLLTVLSIAGALGLMSQLFGNILVSTNDIRPLIVQNIIGLVLNVGANATLVPHYGVYVAAWATVGTELFVVVAALRTIRRRDRATVIKRPPSTVALSLGLAVAAGLLSPLPGVAQCMTTSIVYCALVVSFSRWPFDRPAVRLVCSTLRRTDTSNATGRHRPETAGMR